MNITNEGIDLLKTECPSPHDRSHPFCEVVIPEDFGGNGEDTILFKRISWQVKPDSLERVDWEVFKYPGFQMQSDEDDNAYDKWKALRDFRKALNVAMKRGRE